MTPQDCPKYPVCSANVCPLDKDWKKRMHFAGEPVCQVMTESVKVGAEARFASRPVMLTILPYVEMMKFALATEQKESHGDMVMGRDVLLKQIESAKSTGSRWERDERAGERLSQLRSSDDQAVQES